MTTTTISAVKIPSTLLFLLLNMKNILYFKYTHLYKNCKELFNQLPNHCSTSVVSLTASFGNSIRLFAICETTNMIFVFTFDLSHLTSNYRRFSQLNIRLVHICWNSVCDIITNQLSNSRCEIRINRVNIFCDKTIA